MARCGSCGRVNPEGSAFCQDCGNRLVGQGNTQTPASGVPTSTLAGAAPIGPTCSACGAHNPAGMNFCKMCGAALAAPALAAAPSPRPGQTPAPYAAQPLTSLRTCSSCGGQTPGSFSFCQHCGKRLVSVAAPEQAPQPSRLPQAQGPALAHRPATAPPVARSATSEAIAATIAIPAPDLNTVNPRRPQSIAMGGAQAPSPLAPTVAAPPIVAPPAMSPPLSAPQAGRLAPLGKLVVVRRDGSDGASLPLQGDQVDLGRTDGDLTFAEDRYLAPRHARIERRGSHVVLVPLDSLNGVYVRLQEPWPLGSGDQILIGKEVFRFDLLLPEEREPSPAIQHGVLLFGSPTRPPWGCLRQIVASGLARDVYHLTRTDVVIGREEGELRFADDEFMSRRHALLSCREGRIQLSDLGSSNGTYIRLRGERELCQGDRFRLGDQLFRYEQS
ncbi:MAG: FHA domain-containing protein [Deltaproteobacteria bacterium]|nr:FHA domain-containing protein [Deltaproteobacteria bacterium]